MSPRDRGPTAEATGKVRLTLDPYPLCRSYGFTAGRRRTTLDNLGLGEADVRLGDLLQAKVVRPHLKAIIDEFYDFLLSREETKVFLTGDGLIARLTDKQSAYLKTLGVDFESPDYFEQRLRIGVTHARVGLPLHIYHYSFRQLQRSLFRHLPNPRSLGFDCYQRLIDFLNGILALDQSLGLETYFASGVEELQGTVTALADGERRWRHRARTDPLTGLPNRPAILEALQNILQHNQGRQSVSVLMIDVDHFKQVNDLHGHLVGDKLLREISRRMRAGLRTHDRLGRYGGEEFLAVLTRTQEAGAIEIAERVRGRVAETPFTLSGLTLHVTISIGLESARSASLQDLLSRADRALYLAKGSGRNCVRAASELGTKPVLASSHDAPDRQQSSS